MRPVGGGRRRNASALDRPSTGRAGRAPGRRWSRGRAHAQFRGYSWNREIFNTPSPAEKYRCARPLARGSDREATRRSAVSRRRTASGLGQRPRETAGGREDVAESYGPSTSRSNILANLCPIKINQTPSRAAVSVHRCSAPPSTSATFLRPFNDKVDLR